MPHYFLAIQIDHDDIISALGSCMEDMCQSNPELEGSAVQLRRSHVTLFNFETQSEEQAESVKRIFDDVFKKNSDQLSEVQLEVRGLRVHKRSTANTFVTAKASVTNKCRRMLRRVLFEFRNALIEAPNCLVNLDKDASTKLIRDLKLSINLFSISSPAISVSEATMERYQDSLFGAQRARSVQLLSRTKTEQYYELLSEVGCNNEASGPSTPCKKSKKSKGPKNGSPSKRARPTMFVGMQVNDPEIHSGLREAQIAIMKRFPEAYGGEKVVSKAHITLNVFTADEEAVPTIVEALQRAVAQFEKTPFSLQFRGLDSFRNKVIVVKPTGAEKNRLIELQALIRAELQKLECVSNLDTRPYNPHVTIFNMGKHRKEKHKYLKVPSEAFEDYMHTIFGQQTFSSVQVLSMLREPVDGYYAKLHDDISFVGVAPLKNPLEETDYEEVHKVCCFTPLPKPYDVDEETWSSSSDDGT